MIDEIRVEMLKRLNNYYIVGSYENNNSKKIDKIIIRIRKYIEDK